MKVKIFTSKWIQIFDNVDKVSFDPTSLKIYLDDGCEYSNSGHWDKDNHLLTLIVDGEIFYNAEPEKKEVEDDGNEWHHGYPPDINIPEPITEYDVKEHRWRYIK